MEFPPEVGDLLLGSWSTRTIAITAGIQGLGSLAECRELPIVVPGESLTIVTTIHIFSFPVDTL